MDTKKSSLTISIKEGVSKEKGIRYDYVSIELDGTELTRLFIKPTEKTYYLNATGKYIKATGDIIS